MNEEAYAYFRVSSGDLPLDEITSRMGIEPTQAWRKGDPGTYNPARPHAGWCLYSPLPRSEIVLPRHIEALLPFLEPRASVVVELGTRFRTWLVCVGRYSASSPGLFLSAEVVRRIANLGLALDCDLYFVGEKDQT